MLFDIVKNILDKKVPFKIYGEDTSYRKLNHILTKNAPKNLMWQVLFEYDSTEMFEDYCIVHFHNKVYKDICVDLKVRYVQYIADPSKSHFIASGYQIYKKEL